MAYEKNHFSPVLANKWWADKEGAYLCYFRDVRAGRINTKPQGKRQWGRERRLWSAGVEISLNRELETPVGRIYSGLLGGQAPEGNDRVKWAQFLLSQFVRTPTFLRYENVARKLTGSEEAPREDRVGCEHCADLILVTGKDWVILLAHEDDFFIRSDNPVIATGFLSRPETAIFYALSPRWCFVVCPRPPGWVAAPKAEDPILVRKLLKGGAHLINFYSAKHCDESLILHPDDDGQVSQAMFTEVLGVYPQAPFLLHEPHVSEERDAFASINTIQRAADGIEYPAWDARELESLARSLHVGDTE